MKKSISIYFEAGMHAVDIICILLAQGVLC